MRVAAFLMLMALAGCAHHSAPEAARPEWVNAAGTDQELKQALWECEQEAAKMEAQAWPAPFLVALHRRNEWRNECMEARGWTHQ